MVRQAAIQRRRRRWGRTLSIRLRDLRVPFLWRQIVQFSLVSVSFAKARHPTLGQDKG
ncbi:hypothetical protein KVMX100_70161 [Klebsiella variicola]|nr:hypothetical protein KVMX100_70161 [Klebsiella variicola]